MNFPNGVIFRRRAPVRVILTRYETARILPDQTAHEAMPDAQNQGVFATQISYGMTG